MPSALLHFAGIAILVKAPVFQTDKAGSIPAARSNAPFVYRLGSHSFKAQERDRHPHGAPFYRGSSGEEASL